MNSDYVGSHGEDIISNLSKISQSSKGKVAEAKFKDELYIKKL